ncbi:hypothetical protein C8R44DRAFT_882786 [Mycena epipterygia]|nr:hypothetical protein C8R44DRAFT_882786 [Mycena epipterygia]
MQTKAELWLNSAVVRYGGAAAPRSDEGGYDSCAPGNGVDFVNLKGEPEGNAWLKNAGSFMGPWQLYDESKMGNIFVSNYFAKKHSDVLVSCSVHPGGIKNDLQRHTAGWIQFLSNMLLFPTPMGAYTQLWSATIATPCQITGQYLVPWG